MKDVFIVIAILTMIIGGSIWTHGFYESTKNEFDERLKALEKTIETEENKEEKIKELEKFWEDKESILIIFQDHESIDEIEKYLYECFHYYRINEKDHFDLAKNGVMKGIEDLVKREHLTLVNLF